MVHQRRIAIKHELEDVFVVESGLGAKDRIILDGIHEVRDGDKVEYEFLAPWTCPRNVGARKSEYA